MSTTNYTKEEFSSYILEIKEKLVADKGSSLHAMLALNELLRLPNAKELFVGEAKDNAVDVWKKLSELGYSLYNPPILFGTPQLPA